MKKNPTHIQKEIRFSRDYFLCWKDLEQKIVIFYLKLMLEQLCKLYVYFQKSYISYVMGIFDIEFKISY